MDIYFFFYPLGGAGELLWFPLRAGVEETVSDSEAQQTPVA